MSASPTRDKLGPQPSHPFLGGSVPAAFPPPNSLLPPPLNNKDPENPPSHAEIAKAFGLKKIINPPVSHRMIAQQFGQTACPPPEEEDSPVKKKKIS